MKLSLACDHAAFDAKNELAALLREQGHDVVDHGVMSKDSVDYPDVAKPVLKDVQGGQAEIGILLCGSGIGMSIAANKASGIRAALLSDPYSARMAREHNNANVICLGARVLGPEMIRQCVEAFLGATFEGGKHERRVAKIMELEGC